MKYLYKKINVAIFTVVIVFFSTGCSQSKEVACLQSDKLSFKDPDSIEFIKNIGERGKPEIQHETTFWIRYKAKNSFGAYVSANMVCSNRYGEWIRDVHVEKILVMDIQTELMKARNNALDLSRKSGLAINPYYEKMTEDQMIVFANEFVYQSFANFPPDIPDPKPLEP